MRMTTRKHEMDKTRRPPRVFTEVVFKFLAEVCEF